MADCNSFKTLKGFLIAYNVYFWFSGLAVLGLGIWFYLSLKEYNPVLDSTELKFPAWLLIASGAAIVLFGIIGCLASVYENKCLLGLYFVFLVMVFAAEVTGCVKLFMLFDEAESLLKLKFTESIKYKYNFDDEFTSVIDRIQQQMTCCGSEDFRDWSEFGHYHIDPGPVDINVTSIEVPSSCCDIRKRNEKTCNVTFSGDDGDPQSNNVFKMGCSSSLETFVKERILIVGWTSFGFSIMQLFGSVLACCLRKAVVDMFS